MQIHEAINNVMKDIGAIGKGKYNAEQKFNYRGVDDVMSALQPCFVKHKLYAVPEVLEHTREERQTKSGGRLTYSIIKMKYTFFAEDGSHVEVSVIGEGMDTADKSSNKAMSVAFKYASFQLFCIPTEEMPDPDADSHELSDEPAPKHQPVDEPAPKQQPSDVLTMPGAENMDKLTLFVNALRIAGLTNEDGADLIKRMFGKVVKVNDLDEDDFLILLKALDD